MKFFLFLILTVSLNSFELFADSKSEALKSSAEINRMIEQNYEKLSSEDKAELLEVLNGTRQFLESKGLSIVDVSKFDGMVCDSTGSLVDVKSRSVFHTFVTPLICEKALDDLKVGSAFCDVRFYKGRALFGPDTATLFRADKKVIYVFDSYHACERSIDSVNNGQKFCDVNKSRLVNPDGTVVFSFNSLAACEKAREIQ